MTEAPGEASARARTDPRVTRTRQRVLEITRELLAEHGAMPLTFSLIADEAGVARKTLYAHWGSVAHLIADLLREAHATPLTGLESASEAERIRAFQHEIESSLRDPAMRSALTYLMAANCTDQAAAAALLGLSHDRAAQLGELLGRDVDLAELAQVAGPVFFTRLFACDDGTSDPPRRHHQPQED